MEFYTLLQDAIHIFGCNLVTEQRWLSRSSILQRLHLQCSKASHLFLCAFGFAPPQHFGLHLIKAPDRIVQNYWDLEYIQLTIFSYFAVLHIKQISLHNTMRSSDICLTSKTVNYNGGLRSMESLTHPCSKLIITNRAPKCRFTIHDGLSIH